MRKLFLGLLMATIVFAGCKKKDDGCGENTQTAPAAEEKVITDYLASKSIVATRYKSGMYYQVVDAGAGANSPNNCSFVQVGYKGTISTGQVFDESPGIGFTLGDLIAGWQQAIPLLKKGGKIILYIPPSLAYGARQIPLKDGTLAPANSMLIFEVTLIDFV